MPSQQYEMKMNFNNPHFNILQLSDIHMSMVDDLDYHLSFVDLTIKIQNFFKFVRNDLSDTFIILTHNFRLVVSRFITVKVNSKHISDVFLGKSIGTDMCLTSGSRQFQIKKLCLVEILEQRLTRHKSCASVWKREIRPMQRNFIVQFI